jgi:hypothetical protein
MLLLAVDISKFRAGANDGHVTSSHLHGTLVHDPATSRSFRYSHPTILLPRNHILRPPTFVPTSEPGYFNTNDVPASSNYGYPPAVLSPTYDPASDELPYYQTQSTPRAASGSAGRIAARSFELLRMALQVRGGFAAHVSMFLFARGSSIFEVYIL